MKKTLFFIAAIIWTACSSDHVQEGNLQDKGRILIIEATKGQTNTRGLKEDDNTLKASWEQGDEVSVLFNGEYIGKLTPTKYGDAATTLTGSIKDEVDVKGKQLTLIFPGINHDDDNSIRKNDSRDYTGQIGTLENIAKYYDYATASVTVKDIEGPTVTTNEAAEFENKQAIVRFTLIDDNNQPINANSLTIAANGLLQNESTTGQQTTGSITITQTATPPATNVFYAALSGVENSIITLIANIRDVDNPNKTTYIANSCYSYTKPNVTFTNNKFYSVNVKMKPDPMRSTPLTLESDVDGCEVYIFGGYSNLEYYLLESNKTPEGWKTYPDGTVNGNIQLSKNEWVSFRGTNATMGDDSSDRMNIGCTGNCYVYGNVMSLLDEDNFATMTVLPYENTFQNLFKDNTYITHAEGKDLVLPATKLVPYCYYQMFSDCKNLNYVKCLATDISATSCTTNWLQGVAEKGTFVKAKGFKGWTRNTDNDNGIPVDWTIQTEPPTQNNEVE